MKISPLSRDRHVLYELSVQSVDYDLDCFERIYRTLRGGRFRLLREDFCGTAAGACAWVARRRENLAWGVDLDARTLAWGRRHHVEPLGEAGRRVVLVRGDVRTPRRPRVDVVAAMNFSFWVFKRRDVLRDYFRQVRRSLRPGGLFFANMFGGTESMDTMIESRRIPTTQGPDGLRVPSFTYDWEQKRFDPISHDLLCYIHYRFRDGTGIRRAFTYDWRFWSLPEIREVMEEAGFASSEVYLEGWDEKHNRSDEIYRRRVSFENQLGWIALVVGLA